MELKLIMTKGPNIFHLFFTDDSFIFCKAQPDDVRRVIYSIENYYCMMSGQMINFNESAICVSKAAGKKCYNSHISIQALEE